MEESDVSQIKTELEDPEFIAIKVEPWTCTSQEEHNSALETKCGILATFDETNADEIDTSVCKIEESTDPSSQPVRGPSPKYQKTCIDRLKFGGNADSSDKPFTCKKCGKRYKGQKMYRKHIYNAHRRGKIKSYDCAKCEKTYKSAEGLKNHDKSVHLQTKDFACSTCGKTFAQKRHRDNHEKIHGSERPFSCSICEKSFKVKETCSIHEKLCIAKTHICTLCNGRFKDEVSLEDHHLQKHSKEERPYTCQECNKKFKTKDTLKAHMDKIHAKETPFSCSICERAFKRSFDLDRHFQLAHSGDRPYSCELCDKTFKLKSVLKKHEETHSKPSRFNKRFSCEKCLRKFTRSSH